tara:strand:- start:130 stop:303 length:174 start_codon:yes stop_codon:yes gene_type:complete
MNRIEKLNQLINDLTDVANAGHIGARIQIVEAQAELDKATQIEEDQLIMSEQLIRKA